MRNVSRVQKYLSKRCSRLLSSTSCSRFLLSANTALQKLFGAKMWTLRIFFKKLIRSSVIILQNCNNEQNQNFYFRAHLKEAFPLLTPMSSLGLLKLQLPQLLSRLNPQSKLQHLLSRPQQPQQPQRPQCLR